MKRLKDSTIKYYNVKQLSKHLNRLMNLQSKISFKKLKDKIGSIQKVLVEGFSKKGNTLSGRTENMRTAHFEGGEELIGQIVSVRIVDGIANSLTAELI